MIKPTDTSIIGKKGFKKFGYFAGRVGIIRENDWIQPYKIVFSDGTSVVSSQKDLEVLESEDRP